MAMPSALRPTIPDAATVKGKGTTLKAALAFVDNRWGEDGKQRLLDGLSDDTRKLISGMLVSGGWYPMAQLVEVYETIDRVFGRGNLALCRELGRYSSDYEIRLLHKLFLQLARLEYWLKAASATWRLYYNAGKLEADVQGTAGKVWIREFNPVSKAFCTRFCGWLERTLELSNLRFVSLRHTDCVLTGADACVFEGSWQK